ncbi:MAG: MaoC family dehydratase [Bdellovibrionaceae bacterium]|nr:MaoC family dehydratase [Bdellovibrionales bacterium]MCB9254025.1 MaoC family dehydratase [Pseudobdellovibrionaceae bacterium]
MEPLLPAYKQIGPNRYREVHGMYYDDFVVGDTLEHRPGRTITEVDNIWQSLLCLNTHPLHIDSVYASKTEWERPLISSLVSLAIVGGMSLNGTSARCTANLGWDNIRLVSPLFVGDTIYAETTILNKRESKSRPDEGIVTVETRGLKADGTVFLTYQRSFLVPKKSKKEGLDPNY